MPVCGRGHQHEPNRHGCSQCNRENANRWRLANPERAKELSRRGAERRRQYARKYHSAHRDIANAKRREWYLLHPVETKLRQFKRNAESRGLEFAITDGLAIDLITDNCYYCGASPEPTNGIDRVDNTMGYTENNVVTACTICNQAKNVRTKKEFEAWIDRAAAHQANWRI